MRVNSFRLRIALLSVAVAGFVVLGFGISVWSFIRRANLGRVDEQAETRALRCLTAMPHPWLWQDLQAVSRLVDENYRSGPWSLLVQNNHDQIIYRSPNWPDDLPPNLFSQLATDEKTERNQRPLASEQHPGLPPPQSDGPHAGPDEHFPSGPPPPDPGHDANGHPDFGGEGRGPPFQAPPPMLFTALRHKTYHVAGHAWRFAVTGTPQLTLILGTDLSAFGEDMRRARNAFLLASPVALLLLALGAWFIAQHALRPVARLTEAVEGITASDLAQRLPTDRTDVEFQRLITVFNAMMDRLEKSFEQAARFSADAAHELNTPLTILQGHLDCAIQSAPAGSEPQQAFTTLLEQVQRLKTVMQKLLLLARADAGRLTGKLASVDLSELLGNLPGDIQDMAPELALQTDLAPDVFVRGDRDLLLQLLQNLVSNATKYATGAGWLKIELTTDSTAAILTVANSGEEIDEPDRKRLFDRFYRIDKSRVNRANNVGLGLSLAREIARAHGGDLVLAQAWAGVVAFRLTLPLAVV